MMVNLRPMIRSLTFAGMSGGMVRMMRPRLGVPYGVGMILRNAVGGFFGSFLSLIRLGVFLVRVFRALRRRVLDSRSGRSFGMFLFPLLLTFPEGLFSRRYRFFSCECAFRLVFSFLPFTGNATFGAFRFLFLVFLGQLGIFPLFPILPGFSFFVHFGSGSSAAPCADASGGNEFPGRFLRLVGAATFQEPNPQRNNRRSARDNYQRLTVNFQGWFHGRTAWEVLV